MLRQYSASTVDRCRRPFTAAQRMRWGRPTRGSSIRPSRRTDTRQCRRRRQCSGRPCCGRPVL
jgi:hypothetical protein